MNSGRLGRATAAGILCIAVLSSCADDGSSALQRIDDGKNVTTCVPAPSGVTILTVIGLRNTGSSTATVTSIVADSEKLRIEDFFTVTEQAGKNGTELRNGGAWTAPAGSVRTIGPGVSAWIPLKVHNVSETPVSGTGFTVRFTIGDERGSVRAGTGYVVMGVGQESCK